MKKNIVLLFLIFALLSCKKDLDPQLLSIDPILSYPDSITWDSVAYTVIDYSYLSELEPEEIDDPDVYSHSISIDLRNEPLTLEANQTVVLKKFNMVGKTGEILYFIPYTGLSFGSSATARLPFSFNTGEGKSSFTIPICRYRE